MWKELPGTACAGEKGSERPGQEDMWRKQGICAVLALLSEACCALDPSQLPLAPGQTELNVNLLHLLRPSLGRN